MIDPTNIDFDNINYFSNQKKIPSSLVLITISLFFLSFGVYNYLKNYNNENKP